MGTILNNSPAIIYSDRNDKADSSGNGPLGPRRTLVIDYQCELAVGSLFIARADPLFFPSGKAHYSDDLYTRLLGHRQDVPDRGRILAINESETLGLTFVEGGKHELVEDGKKREGGFGFRHIYARNFEKLLTESHPLVSTPQELMEFCAVGLNGRIVEQKVDRPGVLEVLTSFEYKGMPRSITAWIETTTGRVRNIVDNGRKDGRKHAI